MVAGAMRLLFLQIPAVISFVSLLSDNVANEPTAAAAYGPAF